MGHEHGFLLNIGIALTAGLVGGLLSRAVRLPPLVGYLLAGIVIGPYTPGILADKAAVEPVANLGVMLLMFAVGVQFSLEELATVRKTALVAGGIQIGGSILLGLGFGIAFGWGAYGGLFFGCALALSSTAVVMRVLEERGEVGSGHGSVILGIAVVQDLSLVIMAALLPALSQLGSGDGGALMGLGIAILRAGLFLTAAIFLAGRGVPKVLDLVVRTGSRELFLLTVVVICIAVAVCAEIAGLGLPLGAFLAGMMLSESEYAHEAFSQIRPLRDVFAALFFVSVGMLVDPRFLIAHAGMVAVVVTAIVFGKSLLAAIPISLLGWHGRVALLSGLGLAQIGEFSFVLAMLGTSRGLIPDEIAGVLLSSALVTIILTPFLFQLAEPLYHGMNRITFLSRVLNRQSVESVGGSSLAGERPRALVLGYGRVGRYVSNALRAKGVPHLVIDYDAVAVARCRRDGVPVVYGDATSAHVLERANTKSAELAVVALPQAEVTESTVKSLKAESPGIVVVARVHRGDVIPTVRAAGADAVIHAEFEAGTEMIRQSLDRLGFPDPEVDAYLEGVRRERYRSESR